MLKVMATHSSILAWKIPWAEEPGGLQSIGSQIVGHDWATKPRTLTDEYNSEISLQYKQQIDGETGWGRGKEGLNFFLLCPALELLIFLDHSTTF